MTKFEKYLKERNIPFNSLEANSIVEGIQWTINTAVEWFNNKSLSKVILDGWAVKNVYKNSGPDCFIKFYQSYPIRQENYNHNVILWGDGNGALTPPIQIKTERLFGKECIEQPMKVRITIEQIEE